MKNYVIRIDNRFVGIDEMLTSNEVEAHWFYGLELACQHARYLRRTRYPVFAIDVVKGYGTPNELVVYKLPLEETDPFLRWLYQHRDWTFKTFGPGLRTKGLTAHIRKELLEIESEPTKLDEWVDVVILAFDGMLRLGHSPDEIAHTMEAKQRKNFTRTYPKPASEDEPSEHIRGHND